MGRLLRIAVALLVLAVAAAADMSRGGHPNRPLGAAFGLHFDGADVAPPYTWWAAAFGKAFGGADALHWIVAMTDDRDPWLMQANMQAYVVPGAPTSWGNGWAGQPNKPALVLAIPLGFSGMSVAQVAAGAADAQYEQGFAFMAQSRFPEIVLRLGWEEGGTTPGRNWMKWDEPYDPGGYVAAYRHVHDLAVRALPNAKFEWNTSDPIGGLAAYPGDDVVDIVGLDLYQRPGDVPGFASHLADYNAAVALAEAHGKQIGFSEFGLNLDDADYVSSFCAHASRLPGTGPGSLAYWALFQGTPNDGYTYAIGAFPRALKVLQSCL